MLQGSNSVRGLVRNMLYLLVFPDWMSSLFTPKHQTETALMLHSSAITVVLGFQLKRG